jgi:hypothetical protein
MLSNIFSFLDAKENIPNISAVCKTWKQSLGNLEDEIWECSFKKHHPGLALMMELMQSREILHFLPHLADWNNSWKELYKKRTTYRTDFFAQELNQKLQKDLEFVFRPMGIGAFYFCESIVRDHDPFPNVRHFVPNADRRHAGIEAFYLILTGIGYKEKIDEVKVYRDESCSSTEQMERELIMAWCAVLGKKPDEYAIEDGNDDFSDKLFVRFHRPLILDSDGGIEWSCPNPPVFRNQPTLR